MTALALSYASSANTWQQPWRYLEAVTTIIETSFNGDTCTADKIDPYLVRTSFQCNAVQSSEFLPTCSQLPRVIAAATQSGCEYAATV